MRIITYNVLGLQGYPPGEALEALGSLGGDAHIDHFAGVFAQLDADILALEEGVTAPMIKTIAVSYTHLRAHETPEHRGWRGGV